MKNNNWVRGAMLLAVGLVLHIAFSDPYAAYVDCFCRRYIGEYGFGAGGPYRWFMAVCNDRGAAAGNGVFSRAAAASVFDTGRGCRQLGDGISVCPLLGKGDHHRRASF